MLSSTLYLRIAGSDMALGQYLELLTLEHNCCITRVSNVDNGNVDGVGSKSKERAGSNVRSARQERARPECAICECQHSVGSTHTASVFRRTGRNLRCAPQLYR